MTTPTPENKKLCLVCSSGGHFLELSSIDALWRRYAHFWVTFHEQDTKYVLNDRKVYWAYAPTNRNLKNLIKNTVLAIKVLAREKPDVIITTGAGVGVPFCIVGKLLGARVVFIESLARFNSMSLSGRLIYPFADAFLVQWPHMDKVKKKVQYRGQLV